MKKTVFIIISVGLAMVVTACKGPSKTHNMTSTPTADTPGSGAKMIDSAGKGRPDSTLR